MREEVNLTFYLDFWRHLIYHSGGFLNQFNPLLGHFGRHWGSMCCWPTRPSCEIFCCELSNVTERCCFGPPPLFSDGRSTLTWMAPLAETPQAQNQRLTSLIPKGKLYCCSRNYEGKLTKSINVEIKCIIMMMWDKLGKEIHRFCVLDRPMFGFSFVSLLLFLYIFHPVLFWTYSPVSFSVTDRHTWSWYISVPDHCAFCLCGYLLACFCYEVFTFTFSPVFWISVWTFWGFSLLQCLLLKSIICLLSANGSTSASSAAYI